MMERFFSVILLRGEPSHKTAHGRAGARLAGSPAKNCRAFLRGSAAPGMWLPVFSRRAWTPGVLTRLDEVGNGQGRVPPAAALQSRFKAAGRSRERSER